MSPLPTVELLESTHAFPCAFVFQGDRQAGRRLRRTRAVAAVREELGDDVDLRRIRRATQLAAGIVSVTLEPHVLTAAQVLAIYQRLQRLDGVVMTL